MGKRLSTTSNFCCPRMTGKETMCIEFQTEDLVAHQKKQSIYTFRKHSDRYPGVFIENLLLFCSSRKTEYLLMTEEMMTVSEK